MTWRHFKFLIDILIKKILENINIFRLSIPLQIMTYLGTLLSEFFETLANY